MLALNFSHPFSPDILAQLEQAVGEPVSVRNIRTQFDPAQAFAPQVDELLSDLGDLPDEFIVNPPALVHIGLLVMDALRRADGELRPFVRLRQQGGAVVVWQLAEIIR